MQDSINLVVIGHMKSDFPDKFGIPRQSGLVPELQSSIVFEPEFRDVNALRGLDEFSHIWVLWLFSKAIRDGWSPTVRPPRLGGNRRLGVFATRSPFRPNGIGLSCVRLERIEYSPDRGPVLHVSGADLLDGTPILDIKPYIPYADSVPDASSGFIGENKDYQVKVLIPAGFPDGFPEDRKEALIGILSQDPRPAFQKDPDRSYTMSFAGYSVIFSVDENVLTVTRIEEIK